MNDVATVRLTELGRRIWEERYKRSPVLLAKADCQPMRMHLWELFQVFGGACFPGSAPPFEGATIEFDEAKR